MEHNSYILINNEKLELIIKKYLVLETIEINSDIVSNILNTILKSEYLEDKCKEARKKDQDIRKAKIEKSYTIYRECYAKACRKIIDITSKYEYFHINKQYSQIIDDLEESLKKICIKNDVDFSGKFLTLRSEISEILTKKLIEMKEELFLKSPLINYYNAQEGGETTFYYLKLKNKFGETRYKIGVTLQDSVKQRYSGYRNYEILYAKKLTHANTIEKQILNDFKHLTTDESLLGTTGSEIFKEDILRLDCSEKKNL